MREKRIRLKSFSSRFDLYGYVLIPTGFLLVAFSFTALIAATRMRVGEMRLALFHGDQQLKTDQSYALLGRFKLNYEKVKAEMYSDSNYFDEQKILSLIADHAESRAALSDMPKFMEFIGSRFIQIANIISGIQPTAVSRRNIITDLIDVAYFYERRRVYNVAAQIYEIILETMQPGNEVYPYIFLHLGFCEGLMGNPAAAIVSLKRIEKLSGVPDPVIATAARLRAYIEDQLKQRNALPSGKNYSLRSALDLYYGMQYFDAIETLNTLIRNEAGQELFFYRGRAFEEIGQADKAVADYRRTIYKFPLNNLTRLANRRLFMLAAFYENNPVLREEAVQRAKLLGDEEFIRKSELYEKAARAEVPVLNGAESPQLVRILGMVEKRSRISLKPGVLMKDITDWTTQHSHLGNKILQDADPELSTKGKLLPDLPPVLPPALVKILTKDGNSFLGYITQESGSQVSILTDIGRIRLDKKDIAARQQMPKDQ